MSLVMHDAGELAYGGLVTGMKRWDKKRVEDAKITDKEIWKKYSTYGYLIPGAVATGAQALGWMKKWNSWTERLAHGFIYGFPGFIMDVVDAYSTTTASKGAVNEAEAFLRAQRRAKTTGQTPKPGFEGLRTY